jgi:glycosyltransferase involved in cell wall biosynthesis
MKDLKIYCPNDFIFIDNANESDVIITNDVFPNYLKNINKVKVKRMDGVYWQEQFKERNIPLNESAQIADLVIFISEFSKNSYFNLYGNALKNNVVIKNNADSNIFKNLNNKPKDKIYLCASASNWTRPEKRLSSIIKLIEYHPNKKIHLNLIGEVKQKLPNNVTSFGYTENQNKMSEIMNMSNIFVNFSYKDACPKTVIQSLHCGLPVLYADSGGVREMVGGNGFGIIDSKTFEFEDMIPPELNIANMIVGLDYIINNYDKLIPTPEKYEIAIQKYFNSIRNLLDK